MPKEPVLTLKQEQTIDFALLGVVLLLSLLGIAFIYSAVYDSQMSSFFTKQIISTVIGLASLTLLMYLPKNIIRYLVYIAYGGSIFLLVLVLFIGKTIYGTKGWINFGGFSLQPAEFAKIGTLMMLAQHLAQKGVNVKSLRDFLITTAIVIVPGFLIMRQPDPGSMSVFIMLYMGTLFWSGFYLHILYFVVSIPIVVLAALKGQSWFIVTVSILSAIAFAFRRKLVIMISGIVVLIGVGFASPIIFDNLMEHQKPRINTFLNPGSDPQGSGYNVLQSILAVGSGGLTGKGYLQGTQTQLRYIPMQWTDFIFSVPTEEFGFLGGVLVILLYIFLIYRLIIIANTLTDRFFSLIAFGTATIFMYHITISIGMVIGLAPVMGIPLPFLSYGGTAMLINMSLIGLVLNGWRDFKSEKKSYI